MTADEPDAAAILRVRAVRESDLVLVLLTRQHGRLDVIARGARRSRRRFPAGLAVGQRGRPLLSRERGGWWRLDSFENRSDHSVVGRDLERFAYVSYVAELADVLITGSEPDPSLFELVDTTLAGLIDSPTTGRVHASTLRQFELRLLHALGLAPALSECAVCSRPVPTSLPTEPAVARPSPRSELPPVAFDVRRGGILCSLHASLADEIDRAVLRTAAALVAGHEHPQQLIDRLPVSQRKNLRDLCQSVIALHVARPLRSVGFFANLNAAKSASRVPPEDRSEAGED